MSDSLPTSWTVAALEEIALVNDRSFCLLPDADELPVNFVPMSAVTEDFGGIDVSAKRRLGEVKKGYTTFSTGDVLIAKITPCMENGKVALVPELPCFVAFGSTEFHVVRGGDAVLPDWIAHFVAQPAFRKEARRNMTGSAGQMRVPSQWLRSVRIPVAPPAEQRRVLDKVEELLTDLDAGVAELKAAQKKLEKYRQSLLKAAVDGSLTASWREARRHSGAEPTETGARLLERTLVARRERWEARQLARFKSQGNTPPKGWQSKYAGPVVPEISSLPKLPSTWVWASLDMLGEIVSGVAKGTKRDADIAVREVPYLRVANVQRGYLDLHEVKTILAAEKDIEELTLQDGDVLFNEGGDRDKLGRGWVWRNEVENCIHQNHVFRMRPYLREMLPEFVSHHGNTFGKAWFQSAGKQTTNLASINMGMLRAFPVPVAPKEEQQEVLSRLGQLLDALGRQEEAVALGLKQASAQRQNILKAAFSGRLVPQDPNDEPASMLLERIRAERAARAAGRTTTRGRKAKAVA